MSPLVLLLDDDDEFRYGVSRFLTRESFDVIALSSSLVALDMLDRFAIDVVLVDIQLAPGQPHGFAFSRMAKRKRPGLPCLYMASHSVLGVERVAWPDRLLHKPIDLARLSAEIRSLLRASAAAPATRRVG